jgi:N-acetylmuramoyl-L-alanine amidase
MIYVDKGNLYIKFKAGGNKSIIMNVKRRIIIGLFAILCGVFIFNFKAYAKTPDIIRYGGEDRYDTSVEVSKNSFTSSENVIIASGEDFADALSSAPLAGKYNAPIIITEKDKLSYNAISEIKRLGAKEATIVGGSGVVSDNVKSQLEEIGINVTRLWGKDRYATSVEIAKEVGTDNGIAVASGNNFADALSIAPIAGAKQIPIILVGSNGMSESVREFVDENKTENYYVIGGKGVISDATSDYLGNYIRLSGNNRYETNTAVIEKFLNMGYINMNTVYIASGAQFPDALSASAAAANSNSPIVLANPYSITQQTIIKSNISSVSSVKVIGGQGAVSDVLARNVINGKSITVTLDPGHGGYDSGAVGPSGTLEKNITLAITLKIGKILSQNGINVVYTRTSDNVSWPANVSEDLQKRCDISDEANSDYFVAIHTNSAEASSAQGTESYYYSSSKDGKELAEYIQSSLVDKIGTIDRGIKTANYYVIKYTEAPAVLVEVGFISNPTEEKLLNSSDFQTKAAEGIANGIMEKINKDNQS